MKEEHIRGKDDSHKGNGVTAEDGSEWSLRRLRAGGGQGGQKPEIEQVRVGTGHCKDKLE